MVTAEEVILEYVCPALGTIIGKMKQFVARLWNSRSCISQLS